MPGGLRANCFQALPGLSQQADRLIGLGVHEIGGFAASELRAAVPERSNARPLLVILPARVPASTLASLLEHGRKHGFIVVDMPDVDNFGPIEQVMLPSDPVYLIDGLDRGDHMANWSPDEAFPSRRTGGPRRSAPRGPGRGGPRIEP